MDYKAKYTVSTLVKKGKKKRKLFGEISSENIIEEHDGNHISDQTQLILQFAIDKNFTISKLSYLVSICIIVFHKGYKTLSPSEKLKDMHGCPNIPTFILRKKSL